MRPTRCPGCGADIPALLVAAAHQRIRCPRCRSELEIAAPDSMTIVLASLVVSLALATVVCSVFDLRGFVFIAGLAVATAIFYLLGGFIRTLIATPKLRTRSAPLPSSKRLHARH